MLSLARSEPLTLPRIPASAMAESLAMNGRSDGGSLDLPAMEGALAEALNHFGPSNLVPELLQGLAERDPHLFLAAGIRRLGLQDGPPGQRRRSLGLIDAPAFLLELVRSRSFSDGELKKFCAK